MSVITAVMLPKEKYEELERQIIELMRTQLNPEWAVLYASGKPIMYGDMQLLKDFR